MATPQGPRPGSEAVDRTAASGALSRRALITAGSGLVVAAAGIAALPGLRGKDGDGTHPPSAPFTAHLGRSGLVTNEYAYRNPHAADAHTDADWSVTSGSLFALNGDGWTGRPDSGETGADSRTSTGSAVFRLVTHRRDFADVDVRSAVRIGRPITTARTPLQDYDGGHVWLRYHSPEELYALSFRRRDGLIVIKRKIPADDAAAVNEGDYATLAQAEHGFAYDTWHNIRARVRNQPHGDVRLSLEIDGRIVLSTLDRSPGPLRRPGGVGLRGDNSELTFRAFTATSA